ncbi:MAG TPA: flagellar biosynthetic protein FliO [Pseudoxanthomonas sp.]|nr:flagellar biosynthetic protein FliO [Pseudoxanthomonas sp.]
MIPLLATAAAAARPAAQAAAQAPGTPGLLGAFMALLLVLGLILGLAWLLRRLPGAGFRPADGLRVVASLPLGAKERAVVIEVGGRQLLLGVSAGGVALLHALPEPLPPAEPVRLPQIKDLPDFAQLLARRLRKDP